jgi:hypothetical protein
MIVEKIAASWPASDSRSLCQRLLCLSQGAAELVEEVGAARAIVRLDEVVRHAVGDANQLSPYDGTWNARERRGTAGVDTDAETDGPIVQRECPLTFLGSWFHAVETCNPRADTI